MKLLTKAIEKQLPKLYATEKVPVHKKVCIVKYFYGDWTWYAVEYSPEEELFFGLVVNSMGKELGYFSLKEFEDINRSAGYCKIERDLYFDQCKLGEFM